MKEKNLLKAAFIASLIGVLILFIVSENISVDEKTISKITFEDLDKKVKIKGLVEKVIDTEKVVIMEVVQAENMDVILFKDGDGTVDVKEGDFIEVIGRVEEYEGELEVIGQRVRVIR